MPSLKWIWLISLILKLIISAWLPLSADESYYWVWSKHLQLSYYDHPAMIAGLYWLGSLFEDLGRAVRWPGVILAHMCLLVWLEILKPYLTREQLTYWLILAVTAPLIGWGAIIVTPDIPMLFFWSLAILAFQKWLERPHFKWSLLFGISLGLGFTSKYLIALAVPLFFYQWLRSGHNSAARWRLFFIALATAVLGALPVLWWNYQNDFISFQFQLSHGLGRSQWKPMWTLSYLGGQILILFPTLLWWAWKSNGPQFLKIWVWPLLAFFLFSSFRGHVEANWPIMVTAPLLALAVSHPNFSTRALKRLAGGWSAIFLILLIIVQSPAADKFAKNSKLREMNLYSNLVPQVKNVSPLYARSYQMAAKLSYELGRPVYKLKGMNRRDYFDFQPQAIPAPGVYYLIMNREDSLPEWVVGSRHEILWARPLDGDLDLVEVRGP